MRVEPVAPRAQPASVGEVTGSHLGDQPRDGVEGEVVQGEADGREHPATRAGHAGGRAQLADPQRRRRRWQEVPPPARAARAEGRSLHEAPECDRGTAAHVAPERGVAGAPARRGAGHAGTRPPPGARSRPVCAGRPRPRAGARARRAAGRLRERARSAPRASVRTDRPGRCPPRSARSKGKKAPSGSAAGGGASGGAPRAGVGWARARPRERRLLAGGGRVQRAAEHARRGRRPVHRVGAIAQAQKRRGVTVERGAHGARERRSQGGIEVARDQHDEQVRSSEGRAPNRSAPSDHGPAQRPAGEPPHERRHVGDRVGSERPASRSAEHPQHARHGLERVEIERVRPLRLDHRVEHEPLDASGVRERVSERDLGAVGRAEQGDALVAERDPDRLDVLRAVAARVEGPARPEPGGAAAGGRPRVQQVRALERPATQEAGPAGAALVEDDQVAVAVGRVEHGERAAAERVRGGLAGTAGQHDERAAPWTLAGTDALDEQRHPPGERTGAVQRDAHARALEAERAAALEARHGLRRRRESEPCRHHGGRSGARLHRTIMERRR